MTIDHELTGQEGEQIGLNGSLQKKRGSRIGSKSPKGPSGAYKQRTSPLAFQVKKSLSKKNLRMSPSATSNLQKMHKSPSLDHHETTPGRLRGSKNGIITLSHRANLNFSVARNSNRGIVTMSSRNGLKSGTVRVKSGRRRGSAMSHRSLDSGYGELSPSRNEAVNQNYDKNLGRAFDRFNSQ